MTITLVGTPDPEPVPRRVLILGVNQTFTGNASAGSVVIEPQTDWLSTFTSVGWRYSDGV